MHKIASQPCPFCEEPHSALDHARALLATQRGETPPVCSCVPDDDPECPVHGCTCSSVAAHLIRPCAWGKSADTARERQSAARVRVDGARADEDRREALERGRTVSRILARCSAELALLERIANLNADEVNGISAAKGYVERAEGALERGLGL